MVKRIISLAAALAAALTFSVASVYADEEESKNTIRFEADGSMLVAENQPALSFDSEAFEKYIHLTRDAEKANIKFSQDRDTYYQGASMRISAKTDGVEGYMSCSGMVRDADNNLIYPDAPEAEDTSKFSVIGVELQAADFGLSCFDGCMITFAYRMTAEDETALLDKSVWVFPTDDDYVRLADTPIKLSVNTTLDDNVSQYRKSYVTVGTDVGATKVVFEVPTIGAINGDALYLDNLVIQLPDDVGDNKYIKNLDGYNANAEPREIIEELKITKKGNTIDSDSEIKKSSDKVSPIIFVVVGVAVVIVGVAVFLLIKKFRNRFY